MANLGEILAQLLEGAGTGAGHQYAMKTRGADYLQKDEAALNAAGTRGLAQGETMQNRMLKEAALVAAQREARERGVASPGADPVTASAELDESRKSALEGATLEKMSSGSDLSDARAEALLTPEERLVLQKLKNTGALDVQGLRGKALVDAARVRGANRPPPSEGQAIPYTVDGVQGFYYPKTQRFQPGPQGGHKTPGEAAQAKSASANAMITMLDAMEQIPDGTLGPKAALVAGARGGLVADALGVDPPSENYANAQALVGGVRDDLIHALTGAAASVPEMRRLIQHIPDTQQRDVVRKANIRITKAGLQIAEGLKNGLLTPDEARTKVLQLLGSPLVARPTAPGAAPATVPKKKSPYTILSVE